ncbi:hypothetical protein NMY22_g11392 [Coprinellus aureogranulatus]|nr:hypothetical protein NMY22_g11392 [Coprinellus aureogranulatus]
MAMNSASRPRARSARIESVSSPGTLLQPVSKSYPIEQLLREVEQGSITHINRLAGPVGWPNDAHDGSLVLKVLFNLLDREETPYSGTTSPSASRDTFRRIRSTFTVLAGPAIKAMEEKGSLVVDAFARVFQDNIPTLMMWLEFVCRESPRVFADFGFPKSVSSGLILAANLLSSLYEMKSDSLRAALNASSSFTDLLLYMWHWRGRDAMSISYTFMEQDGACPLIVLLNLLSEASGGYLDLEAQFSGFPVEHHRAFIRSAIQRLEEWSSREEGSEVESSGIMPLVIISVVKRFLHIPAYAEAYIALQFPKRALSMARQFPDILSSDKFGVEARPLPIVVAMKFFPPAIASTPARLVHKTVPGLLAAGLLNVLVHHLVSQPEGTSHPWDAWTQEEEAGNPIAILATMCVDHDICYKTAGAIENLPPPHAMRVKRGWYAKYWTPFWDTFQIFYGMWTRTWHQKPVSLCDNLNHEDWEVYHKEECAGHRLYRTEREIAASWVSHFSREFFLNVLQHTVINFEMGLPTDTVITFDSDTHAIEDRHNPLCVSHQALIEQTRDAIIQINMQSCPPKAFVHPLQAVLNFSHGGVKTFKEPRYIAMLRELIDSTRNQGNMPRNGRLRLAVCVAYCGLYRIYVFGRFVVEKSRDRTKVELLNGYVKVEERAKVDEEMVESMEHTSLSQGQGNCDDPTCQGLDWVPLSRSDAIYKANAAYLAQPHVADVDSVGDGISRFATRVTDGGWDPTLLSTMTGKAARAQAKDHRIEAVLLAVEQGSTLALHHLPNEAEVCRNPHDGALAIGVVFRTLQEDSRKVTHVKIKYPLTTSSYATDLEEEEDVPSVLEDAFLEHSDTLFHTMDFISRNSSWIYFNTRSPATAGTVTAALVLYGCYALECTTIWGRDDALDLLLWLWMLEYTDSGTKCSLNNALIKHGNTLVMLMTLLTAGPGYLNRIKLKVAALSHSKHRRFVESSLRTFDGWVSDAWTRQDPSRLQPVWLQRLILLTQEYLDIPSFARAYAQSGFAQCIVEVASSERFRSIQGFLPRGPRAQPFDVAVSSRFFPPTPRIRSPLLTGRVVADLLDVGLLNIIVRYMLTLEEDEQHPWTGWERKAIELDHPLFELASMFTDVRVCKAAWNAFKKIAEAEVRLLSTGWKKKYWKPFSTKLSYHFTLWEKLAQSGARKSRLRLCDNLKHHEDDHGAAVADADRTRQCSNCRAVVYCSAKCQRDDWDAFHRDECYPSRIERIERELQSSWIPHDTRPFFLSILAEALLSEEDYGAGKTLGKTFDYANLFFEEKHKPRRGKDDDAFRKSVRFVLALNIHPSPYHLDLDSAENLLKVSHGGRAMFNNPRYIAMFRDHLSTTAAATVGSDKREERTRLALCVSYAGAYRILTLGRFAVVRAPESTSVKALNGYVKVVETESADGDIPEDGGLYY